MDPEGSGGDYDSKDECSLEVRISPCRESHETPLASDSSRTQGWASRLFWIG